MDHERLLGFIGEHGVAGGQLCLNVASILSGRLVDGNKKVVDMGKELQASLAQLQKASSADAGKDQALRQMQGKVANMQNAFKGSAVKKSSNLLTIAASVIAVISSLGMVGLLVSMDDTSAREAVTLAKKVEKLEANEEFYLGLKKKLEDENQELVQKEKSLINEKEELALNISRSMESIQDLKDQLKDKERELSDAKDDIVRAQRIRPEPIVNKVVPKEPVVSQSLVEQAVGWSKTHTTLVFPMSIQIKDKPIILQDAKQMVKIPVPVGKVVRAKGYHPQSSEFLVVAQEKSDKFLATIRMENSNFVDLLLPKFQNRAGVQDRGPVNPLLIAPKSSNVGASPSVGTTSASSINSTPTATPLKLPYQLLRQFLRKTDWPAKSEDMLGSMDSPKEPRKSILAIMGANCVCKDCRAKKVGKGSLFPDL